MGKINEIGNFKICNFFMSIYFFKAIGIFYNLTQQNQLVSMTLPIRFSVEKCSQVVGLVNLNGKALDL